MIRVQGSTVSQRKCRRRLRLADWMSETMYRCFIGVLCKHLQFILSLYLFFSLTKKRRRRYHRERNYATCLRRCQDITVWLKFFFASALASSDNAQGIIQDTVYKANMSTATPNWCVCVRS